MNRTIYIYGASGHGLVIADIAKACGYENIIFIDDGKINFPSFNDIKSNNQVPIALGIGDNLTRKKIFEKVQKSGFKIKTLIHPNSIISSTVDIGKGTIIMPNVVVNANAKLGNGVILNSGCIVEHECYIGDFAHISPNAALAGNVKIGELTHIGIGSCAKQNISIGKNVIVGAGAVVINDIPDNMTVAGNPAVVIRK